MSLLGNAGSPELSLLIRLCLLPERVPAQEFSLIDEKRLLELAHWHGVKNLVFAAMPPESRDGWLYQQLQASATHATFHSLNQTNQLLNLIELFDKSKIPVFAYKGVAWSKWLYNDLNSRTSGDIDLLVPRAYFVQALKEVEKLGFKPDEYRHHLLSHSAEIRKAFFRTDYHVPMYNDEGVMLELHWQPAYSRLCFEFPDDEWYDWQQPLVIQNHTINAFRNEYQLLLLLLHHAGKEQWAKLKYLADLTAYLYRYADTTDWDLVLSLAAQRGMKGLLQHSLAMINTLIVNHSFAIPEKSKRNMGDFLQKWDKMEELPENSTWPYFVHAMRERDGITHRFKVVRSHIQYFTEFNLLKEKMLWYRQKGDLL
jgi:hypothetical protein